MKILIVDDIEQNLYMLQVLLEGHGYKVVSAANGAEALEMARRDPPDLIITDILMPVMDGFTLCRKWKIDERLKEIPFVFYTATYTDPKDEELALNLGAERFIVKPLEPDALIGILNKVIEENPEGRLIAPCEPVEDEEPYFKEYNEALIRKLEKKMLDIEKEITERKRAEEALRHSEKRLEKINECFLSFGTDSNENINRLTALCGELLGATCALYNRFDGGMLCSWGQWNTPVDYNPVDKPDGHICYDVIKSAGDQVLVVTNLPETHYAHTDPNVIPFKLQTYIGRAVKLRGIHVGSLCAVYQDNVDPTDEDKRIIEIVASAIGVEEDRKRSNDDLKESEERFSDVSYSMADWIWEVDKNGRYTYASGKVKQILGYDSEELIGKTPFELMADDEAKRIREVFESIASDKKPIIDLENWCLTKNGQGVCLLTNGVPIIDEKGELLGYRGVDKDITERKQAEEVLRENEQKYRSVVENIGIGVSLISSNMEILALNNQMKKWFPWIDETQKPICYQAFNDPPQNEICSYCPTRTTLKDGQRHEAVTETPKGNEVLHYRIISTPIKDKDGNIISAIEMVEDITERKRAEEALKESEEKYRSMMDAMTDLVYICSSEYKVVYMNPAMILRTGRDGAGEHCYRAINDLEERCPWCVFEKVQEGQKCETDIVSPKDKRNYHISHSPIFNDDGSVFKMTIYRDITELKQAEKDKKKLEKQLQQAQKMEAIGTLAGGIAHDFNNVLGAIIGYTGMMEMFDVPKDSPMKAWIKEVLKAADRAKDLVKQILTFSRQTEQERKPVQLNHVVKEAVKFLRASLPATIEIRQDIANEEFIALADSTQMHQILMNLCTNAGHAMTETGGRLEIGLSALDLDAQSADRFPELRPGPHLKLTVSDTGHGIPLEIMERIFDPFFTTKKIGEGTGMGLSVVHGIVKSHEGVITVDSELGQGSVFEIILPRIAVGAVESAAQTLPAMPIGTERILFVDDEKYLAILAQEILERLGYDVVAKTASTEALEVFRSQPDRFDLVITDQTMPHITGIELAREVMKIRPDIPVILCTGYSETATLERVKTAGIRTLINKPMKPSSLAQTVRRVLDNK